MPDEQRLTVQNVVEDVLADKAIYPCAKVMWHIELLVLRTLIVTRWMYESHTAMPLPLQKCV